MYQLHTVPTPNGHKISIMLEELAQAYDVIEYDISAGDQFKPELLALNPNNKLPVMVDPDADNFALAETGAILIYLADKHGQFLSKNPQKHYSTLQWLMFQMSAVGPLQGQAHHYVRYAKVKQEYAQERYLNETRRQCQVMESVLAKRDYLAWDYSIADIACWPWIRCLSLIDIHINKDFPALSDWFERIAARDGVQKGKDVIHGLIYDMPPNCFFELDDATWSYSFGDEQFKARERGTTP